MKHFLMSMTITISLVLLSTVLSANSVNVERKVHHTFEQVVDKCITAANRKHAVKILAINNLWCFYEYYGVTYEVVYKSGKTWKYTNKRTYTETR